MIGLSSQEQGSQGTGVATETSNLVKDNSQKFLIQVKSSTCQPCQASEPRKEERKEKPTWFRTEQELCSLRRKARRLLPPQAYANLLQGLLFIRMESEPHSSYGKEKGHSCGNGMQQFFGRILPTTTLIRAIISDRVSLYLHLPPNIGVAFPHSHLQEDKGKAKQSKRGRTKGIYWRM